MCYNPAQVRNKLLGAPASVKLVYYMTYVDYMTSMFTVPSLNLITHSLTVSKWLIHLSFLTNFTSLDITQCVEQPWPKIYLLPNWFIYMHKKTKSILLIHQSCKQTFFDFLQVFRSHVPSRSSGGCRQNRWRHRPSQPRECHRYQPDTSRI